jgi:hypothetical protein
LVATLTIRNVSPTSPSLSSPFPDHPLGVVLSPLTLPLVALQVVCFM